MDSNVSRDIDALLEMAQELEYSGQYDRAVKCYFSVAQEATDVDFKEKYLIKAADLALKFLKPQRDERILKCAARMLLDIKKHSSAAQLFLSIELDKEAVEALIAGGEWSRAKKLAQVDPRLTKALEAMSSADYGTSNVVPSEDTL